MSLELAPRGTSSFDSIPETSLPRVLVVDDVPANLKVVEAILEPLRCETILVNSGRDAVERLGEDEFAVLLIDVQMPVMDGYAVAEAARKDPKTKEVPIIFLTAANLDDANILRGYGRGAVDLLFKPLNAAILRSKVQVFLELYTSRRRIVNGRRELERAYEELKHTQAQLVQSAKMASLGELVGGIAHEINNPLAFALSHLGTATQILERAEEFTRSTLPPQAKTDWVRAMDRIRETSVGLARIQSLVEKLRAFSSLDRGEWYAVGVRDSIESALMILNHRLQGDIVVETTFGVPDVVECYPGLLNQAIVNILANAIDAVAGSGKITIVTGATAGRYEITIADSGPGIPRELLDRVFEPFFTTKPIGGGTGLGLSISYSIARKHGGDLLIECPEGGGTKMVLTFPVTNGRRPS